MTAEELGNYLNADSIIAQKTLQRSALQKHW